MLNGITTGCLSCNLIILVMMISNYKGLLLKEKAEKIKKLGV